MIQFFFDLHSKPEKWPTSDLSICTTSIRATYCFLRWPWLASLWNAMGMESKFSFLWHYHQCN